MLTGVKGLAFVFRRLDAAIENVIEVGLNRDNDFIEAVSVISTIGMRTGE